MHVYIYDSFLSQKKFDSVLAKIEIRITDLGLNGKISRLGPMKNIKEMIENELRRGAKTIVVVGNDQIASEAINILAGKPVPLGIIPIKEGLNMIAKSLGIDFAEKACDTLSARRIEKVDLLSANNFHFLYEANIPTAGTALKINDFSVETDDSGEIKIINIRMDENLPDFKSDPQDGIFELFITTKQSGGILRKMKKSGESYFPLKSLSLVSSNKQPLLIDGLKEISTPVEIKISPRSLNIIVGKDRAF